MTLILSGTAGLSDVDGSAATPAIRGTDTNTGIFFPAADTIAFAEGGTEAMRLDSAGNMGLGVTPLSWSGYKAIDLQGGSVASGSATSFELWANSFYNGTNSVYRVTGAASLYNQSGGLHRWYNAPSGTAGNAITFTQAMTLDASGNLAIRAVSNNATTAFNIQEDSGVNLAVFSANEASGEIRIGGVVSGYFPTFYSSNAERARIDSSGNLLVGQTTQNGNVVGFSVSPNGVVRTAASASTNAASTWETYSTGASAYRFYVGFGGQIYATSTSIAGISDQRLKENIRDLDDGLSTVMALQPRKFDWKEGKGADTKNVRGFIAQEFEQVFPDLIDEWKDPAPEGEEPYKSVRADLIPVLVKAIQEQQALIAQLQADVAALKGTQP